MNRSILLLGSLLFACGGAEPPGTTDADTLGHSADTATPSDTAGAPARAEIRDADGRSLGVVTLRQEADGVRLVGTLTGLPPGEHGFHIHAVGACEPPSFGSAGGHFDPGGDAHGFDAPGGPHAGDLRNLTVGEDGTAVVDATNDRVTLDEGPTALLDDDGAAIVVHAGPDDYTSQPSGAAGARIGCGPIER